jgi:hypothetical protein
VKDQGHPLDQLLIGADHAVQPPKMIVADRVHRCDRETALVDRGRTGESGLAGRSGQRADCILQAHRSQTRLLTGTRPEARPADQPTRLFFPETPRVNGWQLGLLP